MFRYYSCRFANERSKRNCSRLALCRHLNLPTCYTIEVSMMGFLNKDRQTIELSFEALQVFGKHWCESMLDWFHLLDVNRNEQIKRAI